MKGLIRRFKDFSLRIKFVIAFIINGILMGTAMLIIIYPIIMSGLDKVENYYLESEFFSVHAAIEHNLDMLLRDVRDYAYSDNMYDYANNKDEAWVQLNVINWVPKNLGIDLILIFDTKGKLIYQYGNFAEFGIGEDLSGQPLIKRAFESREIKGLYSVSKGLLYVASSQIMHTDEAGPRNGTLLYGKLLNKSRLEKLKSLTGMNSSIISKNGKPIDSTVVGYINRPKNLDVIYNVLGDDESLQFKIQKPHYQSSFIYSILRDTEGKAIGMLEIIRPRKTIPLVRELVMKSSFGIFIFAILAIFITVWVITGFILKPLHIFRQAIEYIRKTKDVLKRVEVESEDEVGILAKEFNRLLDTLNEMQNKLQEAQENLVKSEKMAALAEMAMGTVHQINNPLSIVMGRLQLLERLMTYKTSIPLPDLEKDLKIIQGQTQRAIEITNSLLSYASPITLRFERCNINELLKDTVSLIKEQFMAEKINIMENLKTDLPSVEHCDRQKMQDVFMNIMMNAKQAMSEAGQLKISTDYVEKEDMVSIEFRDNGCGITPEHINKLFTPFFSTKADRSGLGLAISYNIIKGHLGTIDVESELGVGSTFTVKLPRAKIHKEEEVRL